MKLTPYINVSLPMPGRLAYIVDSKGETYTYLFKYYEAAGDVVGFFYNVDTNESIYLREGEDWKERYEQAYGG